MNHGAYLRYFTYGNIMKFKKILLCLAFLSFGCVCAQPNLNVKEMEKVKSFIVGCKNQGMSNEDIAKAMVEVLDCDLEGLKKSDIEKMIDGKFLILVSILIGIFIIEMSVLIGLAQWLPARINTLIVQESTRVEVDRERRRTEKERRRTEELRASYGR